MFAQSEKDLYNRKLLHSERFEIRILGVKFVESRVS